MQPLQARDAGGDAATVGADAQDRLTGAVCAVKRSWAEFGAAAGTTRQFAHKRWARHVEPAERARAHAREDAEIHALAASGHERGSGRGDLRVVGSG